MPTMKLAIIILLCTCHKKYIEVTIVQCHISNNPISGGVVVLLVYSCIKLVTSICENAVYRAYAVAYILFLLV